MNDETARISYPNQNAEYVAPQTACDCGFLACPTCYPAADEVGSSYQPWWTGSPRASNPGERMKPADSADDVRRAVERITSTQARCGTKLMQVPADFVWPGSKWEADDVDLEFLVRDILDAAKGGA